MCFEAFAAMCAASHDTQVCDEYVADCVAVCIAVCVVVCVVVCRYVAGAMKCIACCSECCSACCSMCCFVRRAGSSIIDHRAMPHIWMSHVTHMGEACCTNDWVMSHTWMSPAIPYDWVVVARTNESCRTQEWVLSHTWMGRVAHVKKSCHTLRMSHVAHMNVSCRTCG